MTTKIFPVLTYADVQKINWFVADTIRDKGFAESSQYKLLALPIISLKRFLDMREEFKKDEIFTSFEYEMENNSLTAALLAKMARHPAYAVPLDKLEWYDVEWSDIVKYTDNPDRNEIEYKLSNEIIKTRSVDKIEFLFEVIESFSNSKISGYFESTEFTRISKKYLPNEAFTEIVNELDKYKLDLKHAEEDVFADAYMYLTGKFAEDEGKKGGEFHTPSNLVENCIKLMPPKLKNNKAIRIADLTSGACTLMTSAAKEIEKNIIGDSSKKKKYINSSVEFITQEKNESACRLGEMNMLFHGYENHKSLKGNTITNWKNGYIGDHESNIDSVYANPPYGLKDYGFEYAKTNATKENRWSFGVPSKSDGEYAFLLSAINLLTIDGQALIIMPLGTLFKDSTQAIRKRLIENDLVEGIIELPEKMFLTTGIPVCLWLINMDKETKDKNKIFMINASAEFIRNGKFNVWNAEKTINIYHNRTEEEFFSRYITSENLIESNYNLDVSKLIRKNNKKDIINIDELNSEIENLLENFILSREELKSLFEGKA